MNPPNPDSDWLRKAAVLGLVALFSIVFLWMIRGFLVPLFLAAVFASLAAPLYRQMVRLFRGYTTVAAIATLVLLIAVVVVPCLAMLGIVAGQAYQLSENVVPWVQDHVDEAGNLDLTLPEWVPFRDQIDLSGANVTSKLAEFAGRIGTFLFQSLSAATLGTAGFFLDLFVMLYAMFFFIKGGDAIRDGTMKYLPLPQDAKDRILEKGLSVTRATIKGTLVIALAQGTLAGIAFAVVGIQGAVFWGAVMAVMSIVPGIGTALVWIPAVVFLMATGQLAAGIGLALWCSAVVGSIDNVLRPYLVGRDTEMPDLLILISTLGGLSLFGAVGLLIGPVVAALFMTVMDIYRVTFAPEACRQPADAPG